MTRFRLEASSLSNVGVMEDAIENVIARDLPWEYFVSSDRAGWTSESETANDERDGNAGV